MPKVKTINYSRGLWLLPTIEAAGAQDVIYISNGNVFETPRSNVFVVNDAGEIATAKDGVLYGITRNNLLQAAKGNFIVREEAVSIDQLLHAAEVFITSTTKGVLPITRIDGQPVGSGKPGPVAKSLATLLQQIETDYLQQLQKA
jgi:D-alanine transaminase/branched-chain amino acid aminotransferase